MIPNTKATYDIPTDWYISPVTKMPLELLTEDVLRDSEGNEFHKDSENGYWNFLPEASPLYSQEQWDSFQTLIKNFVVSYNKHPEVNVSYDVRDDALAFGEFVRYHGKVLDIGCGPQKIPSYIRDKRNPDAQYYGVDVLAGEHPKDLNFTQAMGEHLPFKDNLFDITISGTSIMHFVDTRAGIKEALRVTKRDGYFCLWLGVKSPDAPKPSESPDWYKNLKVPDGAVNPFHYKRFMTDEFESIILDCDCKIIDQDEFQQDEWRTSIFWRIQKNS